MPLPPLGSWIVQLKDRDGLVLTDDGPSTGDYDIAYGVLRRALTIPCSPLIVADILNGEYFSLGHVIIHKTLSEFEEKTF